MDESVILISSGVDDDSSQDHDNNVIALSPEQQHALQCVENGKNIFITGSAGVGKSFLLKELLKSLPKRTTYLTASTGVAACNIGGMTLHSFAGIGLGEKSAAELALNIRADVKARWLKCEVLVIDEISMIDGELFEKVEYVARALRNSHHPFGGIQIILCGDFLQLPPVKSQYFAFQSKVWHQVIDETIVLKKVFRQREAGFIKLLNRLRTGTFRQLDIAVLNACRHTQFIDDGIKATRLFPTRASCDELNEMELNKLQGRSVTYASIDTCSNESYKLMLEKNSKLPKSLELRIGAQVMLLVNKDLANHLVNGSRGIIVGFRDRNQTLEEDIENALQLYNNNFIGNLSGQDVANKIVATDIDEDEEYYLEEDRNPIVRFANATVDIICPERIDISVGHKVVASRLQIPLRLAWAMSIHKSQGMTLDRIDVNLRDSFEHGQSYVALSRVTSLDGLLLKDFDERKFTAHSKVLSYYQTIDPDFKNLDDEGNEFLVNFLKTQDKPCELGLLLQVKENKSKPCSSVSEDAKQASPQKAFNSSWLSSSNRNDSISPNIKSENEKISLSPIEDSHLLSAEQRNALESARKGKSIFITGSAGVGKSFLLKQILDIIPKDSSYVTASTGVAACNIGGTTLHSFAGIGLGQKEAVILAKSLFNKSKTEARLRWQQCKVLVIDEISMIEGTLFEKLEEVARIVRNRSEPFGGIQLILCGDFLQLPPVKSQFFAFETKAWRKVVEETIVLKKVFRQKELGFIKLLNRLRTGKPCPLDIDVLNACRMTKFLDDGIKATRLFPRRYSCDDTNAKELRKLKGQSRVYLARDTAVDQMYRDMLEKNSRFPCKLELKCGAQVMLLVNKDVTRHLCNGSRGVVVGFRDRNKSLEDDLHDALEHREEDNFFGTLSNEEILESTQLNKDDEDHEEHFGDVGNPIIRFANGIVEVIHHETLSINVGRKVAASRSQIPLQLAWAVSIHKSQGMTLDRIDVNLAEAFEHGQSYVALSRVTCLDGLLLRDFKASKINAHPKVLSYYKRIDSEFDIPTTDGNDELRTFLEIKNNFSSYSKILQQIREKNDAIQICESSSSKMEDHREEVNYNTHNMKNNKNSSVSITPVKTESKASKVLLRAKTYLDRCKEALQEAKSDLLASTLSSESVSSVPVKDIDSSSMSKLENTNEQIHLKNESDELDISMFENDHFEESLLDCSTTKSDEKDISIETVGTKVSSCSNNFLDNICPDLLNSASAYKASMDKKPLENKQKRKWADEMDLMSPSTKRVANEEKDMKTLLQQKADIIESKRKAALEKRRQSLMRSNR